MPPKFKLSKASKQVLRSASQTAMRDDLSHLHRTFKRSKWLPTTNRYVSNTIERIRRDGPTRLKKADVAAYVSASAPLHCADGWMFLGRALAALAIGDTSTARHMGYYAELRAAMSLLATEGIGIFNTEHFAVPKQGTCVSLPQKKGTHEFTWVTLEHWADQSRAAKLLATVIRPGGQTLHDWLTNFMAGQYPSVASKWLKQWGLDLRAFPEDRDARNEASYRPARLVAVSRVPPRERSDFVTNLWNLAEPTEPSRFDSMDRYLLRESIRQVYKGVRNHEWNHDRADFDGQVTRMINATAPSGSSDEQWLSFLTGASSPDMPILLQKAGTVTAVSDPHHHAQVIARATLLLRIASGACLEALRSTATTTDLLRFWWEHFGVDVGLWHSGAVPERIVDLWADVQDALDANARFFAGAVTSGTEEEWPSAPGVSLVALTACERIALWGIGL